MVVMDAVYRPRVVRLDEESRGYTQRMRTYRFIQVDVFTNRPFGGNQLAVFPEAEGIADAEMQAIAREMNFSETTFVLPPTDPDHDARVRIFTPGQELPMAGHPTVGTGFVLGAERGRADLVFELGVGPTPVSVEVANPMAGRATMQQRVPKHAGEHGGIGALAGRIERGHAQGLPDEAAHAFGLVQALEQRGHGLAGERERFGAPGTQAQPDRGESLAGRESRGEDDRGGEVQRRRQARRREAEPVGIADLEGEALQVGPGRSHGPHERERFAVGAQEEVLPVVERLAAVLDAPGPSAGGPVRIEQRDPSAPADQIDRCGDAGPAGADDADVKSGHVVTQVFHAIQNLRIGVSDTRARITG